MGFDVDTFQLLLCESHVQELLAGGLVQIDGFSLFIDTPLLSCSHDFNACGDWPSEVPAYALPHFFPYPLPLSLWSLSCSTLISLPAVFSSCGALPWKGALAGHFQELTGATFPTPSHMTRSPRTQLLS